LRLGHAQPFFPPPLRSAEAVRGLDLYQSTH
jgi:hypothetical protein